MMGIGAETAVAGIGLWIASIGTIIAVSAGIVQLLISLNTNHTREAVKQVFDSFSSDEGAYKKVYSYDPIMNREFKEIAESIESIAWWKTSWRAIVPLYTSGYRAIDPKTNSENADQTAEIIGQFVRHDVLNVTGLTSSVMSRIRDYKLALQSDADENDDGIPDSQDWLDGTIHADWQPPVNTIAYGV
jgi:hypothetical protein